MLLIDIKKEIVSAMKEKRSIEAKYIKVYCYCLH